ncbi:ecto-ADP-ribosyltransferase 5-like [Boleophthalmus pectinirostris]|uniref:ecto-ADP-ribosyltransferase 5-like n=1 Tax=Boleophthalmus pectinirostris TaxID=150288 RepID=UPI00242CEE72|nr:ecto-ADP-ribosyltransferase 5-like [Boleophthalmus pectinirostris]
MCRSVTAARPRLDPGPSGSARITDTAVPRAQQQLGDEQHRARGSRPFSSRAHFTDMETTVLALMLCLVMTSFPAESVKIPLSMMDKSVDDMYDDCSKEMAKKVKNVYFPREMKNNTLFKSAWENKEKNATTEYEKSHKTLTKKQIQALLVYTEEAPKVYKPLNVAVRDSAAKYGTDKFKYHALHYWLTTAIQKLNSAKTCQTTYRRSPRLTFTGKLNQEIRFGQFTSTSFNPNLISFGTITCFQIKTCLGASIKDYSSIPNEDEVLIPPYEMFKITQIVEGKDYGKLKNCRKIFVLKSTGSQSFGISCDHSLSGGRVEVNESHQQKEAELNKSHQLDWKMKEMMCDSSTPTDEAEVLEIIMRMKS